MLLAQVIKNITADYLIIGGDLLDTPKPTAEEIGLMYDFIKACEKPVVLIAGNHEMVSKRKDCYQSLESMLKDLNIVHIQEQTIHDHIEYIPYNILHTDWSPTGHAKIAVTHVRGEIPPHVTPEIDLSKFSAFDVVFAGDLHSKTNSQLNILYPGSPFTTSFHSEIPKNSNGYYLIDTDTAVYEWNEFNLPHLLRKKVSASDAMEADGYHHVIYAVEGDLEELQNIEDTELLDKKIVKNLTAPPTLNMSGNIHEELAEYLKTVKGIENVSEYITLFKEVTSK
jgi:DNA repair exonuclease SbcCD nuclease subunit